MNDVNLEIAAFFISTLCLIYVSTTKKKQYNFTRKSKHIFINQHFVFLNMLISTIVSSATSVCGYYLSSVASQDTAFWQYLLHASYFLFHNILPICFALYIMNVNGSAETRTQRFYILFLLPFVLCELMVLTNGLTGFVFYMDDQFVYHRGSLITVNYAFGLIYYFIGFVFFFRHQNAVTKNDNRTVGFIMGLSAIGVIVQGLNSALAVELFAESLTIAGIMLLLEERSGHVDPVTGALNRIALVDDCRRLIENHQKFSVVLLDLSNIDLFSKLFNGHDLDSLLIQVSEWLTSISSEHNLYHYRSSDFAIVCQGRADLETEYLVNAILNRFGEDWKTGGASFRLEVVINVLDHPEEITTLEDLTEALASGYIKKGLGSRLISRDERFSNRRSRKIEEDLRTAIDTHLLQVWYQPIWSVENERPISAEALLRVNSDDLRGISPEIYIPIAEQSGLIHDIGLFVFEDVCRFLKSISDKNFGLSYIELNLSVHQFLYDDLVDRFEEIRKRYGIPAEALNLEITESASIGDAPIVSHTMKTLRSLGYTFSLDDFGTGYSNLAQFITGSYKNVKMDKSLLWQSDYSEKTANLLDSLIKIMRSLGCNIVQEGVETAEQLERTKNSGGNLIQGYYFSRPLPENEFVDYLIATLKDKTVKEN